MKNLVEKKSECLRRRKDKHFPKKDFISYFTFYKADVCVRVQIKNSKRKEQTFSIMTLVRDLKNNDIYSETKRYKVYLLLYES